MSYLSVDILKLVLGMLLISLVNSLMLLVQFVCYYTNSVIVEEDCFVRYTSSNV